MNDAERARTTIELLGDAISRDLIDVRPMSTAELEVARPEAPELLKPALLDGLQRARRMVAADPADGVVIVLSHAVSHGKVTSCQGVSDAAWIDLTLDDGRALSLTIVDPDAMRHLAAQLLDNAEALDRHLTGAPCDLDGPAS